MRPTGTPKFTAPWSRVKQHKEVVQRKHQHIQGLVSQLAECDQHSADARDLRRRIAKAREQLRLMQP